MLVKLNFSMSAWVKELMIEAESDLDALRKVQSMTVAELVEAGAIIDSEWDISDAYTEVVERDMTIRAFNIEYDFSSLNMDPAVEDYLRARLPKERVIKLGSISVNEDLEDLIKTEIEVVTDYDVASFEYQIIEEK